MTSLRQGGRFVDPHLKPSTLKPLYLFRGCFCNVFAQVAVHFGLPTEFTPEQLRSSALVQSQWVLVVSFWLQPLFKPRLARVQMSTVGEEHATECIRARICHHVLVTHLISKPHIKSKDDVFAPLKQRSFPKFGLGLPGTRLSSFKAV